MESQVRRYALLASTAASLVIFMLAVLGGGVLAAFGDFLRAIGLGSGQGKGMLDAYPLGFAGALTVYAGGAAVSLAGWKWPVASGAAMLLLGVIAFLFGGPLSKFFAVLIFCCGAVVLTLSLRRNKK